MISISKISKLMVANRGEIAIRVFRSAHELSIKTVAIYAHEDRYALHRMKADETYEIGRPGEPIRSYLDIDAIIDLARKQGVDAIHPGYGFLAENPDLARACRENGIIFVGPREEVLESLGNKVEACEIANKAGVPTISGSRKVLQTVQQGRKAAEKLGYPVILKATKGGGGRGMRIVERAEEFERAFEQARQESLSAFGCADLFLEKYLRNARHIEVQLLGDQHGNLVHLYERDCSFQRRHQKVIEIAPAPRLDADLRDRLCEAALKIGRAVRYDNAGTVEFLTDEDQPGQFYFIEVNPRIQVEHTVTEEVTGIDLIKSQILVAQGIALGHKEIGVTCQDDVVKHGYAIQCRVTTEDPANRFQPDYGMINHYRSASGMGIRLDAGTAFSGAVVTPFYDSLLVKVTARGRELVDAAKRMERALSEFRIRGVKTNLPFLLRLVTHPVFLEGRFNTRIIDDTPDLFEFREQQDRASKLLDYLADLIVNGNPLVAGRPKAERRSSGPIPKIDFSTELPRGTRDRLKDAGVDGFCRWIGGQKTLFLTDTTFRDAHQSLLATRVRTQDLLNIADAYAHHARGLFSMEMWGGATFDVALRFLKECPWQRLADLRQKIPNILFQMLLRASNAVAYTNFPDNVVQAFVAEAAAAGIDVFRVFDSLNWLENMRVAIDAVRDSDAICEAAICYTGDILDPKRPKYDLDYYIRLAKELERMGAQILAIKDMAGVCKPYAARQLITALKQEIGLPIHFHTHDTAGVQAASILMAAEPKNGGGEYCLNIADAAIAPLSGRTSQPNLNTLAAALKGTERDSGLDVARLDDIAEYWRNVRELYAPFESPELPAGADLYRHEMPGGQYTNLFEQARELGLEDRWAEVREKYALVNELFGDIVKVTPTSKAVGDMALFMVTNDLSVEDVRSESTELAFPQSVVDLLAGRMGQPPDGFPEDICRRVLKGTEPIRGRPGETLADVDLSEGSETAIKVKTLLNRDAGRRDVLSYVLYPKVYEEFAEHLRKFGDTSRLDTMTFFYGLKPNEEIAVEIEPGKTLLVRCVAIGDITPEGKRTVFFELNGQPRQAIVEDRSRTASKGSRLKADRSNPCHIGAPMPGMVVAVAVQPGVCISKGQKLLGLEAMKMETTMHADQDGTVGEVFVHAGSQVETGDLLMTIIPMTNSR
jgi:pyruvate carboxylase